MFFVASVFNQDISSWDISSATTIALMFRSAAAFNQDIGGWDTSSVTTFDNTFQTASAFDQDIGGWDVTGVTTMSNMFFQATLSTANYDALLVGWEGQAVQNNVTFHGGSSTYTSAGAGGTARAALIADHTWSITDGGGV
jgi:surface protein